MPFHAPSSTAPPPPPPAEPPLAVMLPATVTCEGDCNMTGPPLSFEAELLIFPMTRTSAEPSARGAGVKAGAPEGSERPVDAPFKKLMLWLLPAGDGRNSAAFCTAGPLRTSTTVG